MEETFQALQIKEVSTRNSCYKCGFSVPHTGKPGPAKQAIYSNCDVKGHFAKVCRKLKTPPTKHHSWTASQAQTPRKPHDKTEFRTTRKARQISNSPANESSSSDDEYTYALDKERTPSTHETFLRLNDSNVKFLIDTGSTVDVIDNPTYQSLKTKVKLEPTKTKLFVYGSSTPLQLHGCFQASIELNSRFTVSTFYVVDRTGGNLLSGKTAKDLALIQLVNTVKGINATEEPPQANKQDVEPVNNTGKEADIPHSEDEVIDKLLEKHKKFFRRRRKNQGKIGKITYKRRHHTSCATATQNAL